MKKNNDQKPILSIIVSYNFMPWIDRCLPSLLGSSQLTDILVVDNASTDETISTIHERYQQVRLIANKHNLGFGAANNIGIRIAMDEGYDGVLLINQDAWLAPGALHQLMEVSLQHPEFGIISPIHMTGNGSELDPGFATYISKKVVKMGYSQSSILNCQFINAAIWYIPITVIKEVGLFAPLFYHYGEDKDYVNRLRYHGYQIGYVPTALGYHDRAQRPFNRTIYLRTEKVYHLSEYANINYHFAKAFAMGVLAPVKKALQAMTKGKWKDFSVFLDISLQLLGKSLLVIIARKKARFSSINT